jgi:hypothetical protein
MRTAPVSSAYFWAARSAKAVDDAEHGRVARAVLVF